MNQPTLYYIFFSTAAKLPIVSSETLINERIPFSYIKSDFCYSFVSTLVSQRNFPEPLSTAAES